MLAANGLIPDSEGVASPTHCLYHSTILSVKYPG